MARSLGSSPKREKCRYAYGEITSKYQTALRMARSSFRFTVTFRHRRTTERKERDIMSVRIEKKGAVWTVIHRRPEARNAMDPQSADALEAAFNAFNAD